MARFPKCIREKLRRCWVAGRKKKSQEEGQPLPGWIKEFLKEFCSLRAGLGCNGRVGAASVHKLRLDHPLGMDIGFLGLHHALSRTDTHPSRNIDTKLTPIPSLGSPCEFEILPSLKITPKLPQTVWFHTCNPIYFRGITSTSFKTGSL